MLDPPYLERYYRAETRSGGPAWHELYLECADNASLAPFQTRSADIRALAGQTALFYSVTAAEAAEAVHAALLIPPLVLEGQALS